MIAKHPPGRSHDSTAATPPITPHRGITFLSCQMHGHHVITKLVSLSSRTAQAFFWRLSYHRLRQRVFRQLRPRLTAYYERMLYGQAGTHPLAAMTAICRWSAGIAAPPDTDYRLAYPGPVREITA